MLFLFLFFKWIMLYSVILFCVACPLCGAFAEVLSRIGLQSGNFLHWPKGGERTTLIFFWLLPFFFFYNYLQTKPHTQRADIRFKFVICQVLRCLFPMHHTGWECIVQHSQCHPECPECKVQSSLQIFECIPGQRVEAGASLSSPGAYDRYTCFKMTNPLTPGSRRGVSE